ncbi:tetratricopeptide repeat protein [Parafrankia sp. BMG5.11]|uniref:tetratricopeptide repeat protein n=1 Tax=Parafrankia sp. BMG5.11 TaxID=222540 RepID=UPI00140499C8|nr:tetratricopeptide repeat protein [Parafrankia sp. BMG5.11]
MSQPVSSVFSFWHKTFWACAGLLLTAACTGRAEQASQYALTAEQQLQAGDLEAARRSIGEALAQRDDIPELHLLKGRIEVSAGSYESAFDSYVNALALDNTNLEALQAVSQLGLRTGNLRESLDATERILALQPGQPNALVARGVHALVQRRYRKSIEYADQVIAQQPGSEEASILKSRALFMIGEPAKALQVMETVQSGGADTEGVARTKLELHREMRNAEGMQAQFYRLRELLPLDPDLRVDEADLRLKLGKTEASQELLVDLLSQKGLGQESASTALELLRNYSLQLSEADVQRIGESGSKASLIEVARHLIETKQVGSAEMILRKLRPDDARPLSARLEVLRGNPAMALRTAGRVLDRDESQCDALTALAEAKLMLSQPSEALRSAQSAAAECPRRSEAWLAMAAAYSAQEDTASVQRAYRDAVRANPQTLQLTMAYGDWLLANNREREALAIARTFTRKSPSLIKGWEYFRSLCARAGKACLADASKGVADARTRYGVDLELGKRPPGGLFGRLVRR